MKRKIICVMSVMMIVLLAAGCGKSDGTSGGSPTRTETTGMETTAPGAGTTGNGNAAGMTESTMGTEAAASKTATETTALSAGETTAVESGSKSGNSVTDARISLSEEEAVKLALEKVPQASKDNIRIHLDYEDGKPVYEGSIVYKGVEYDFEIDAATGTILEWEQER